MASHPGLAGRFPRAHESTSHEYDLGPSSKAPSPLLRQVTTLSAWPALSSSSVRGFSAR
jgi:hypothetical protein